MRCKVDDLVFLTKTLTAANLGKIATVVEYLGYFAAGDLVEKYEGDVLRGHAFASITDHYWVIEVGSNGGFASQYGTRFTKAISPDLWMTPIQPPGVEDDISMDQHINDTIEA